MSSNTSQLVSTMTRLIAAMKSPGGLTHSKKKVIADALALIEQEKQGPKPVQTTIALVEPILYLEMPSFMAHIVCRADAEIDCENCHWIGTPRGVLPGGDADLTAGDEVPAGRCPQCQMLVYVQHGPGHYRELMLAAIRGA